jgi:gliding motility-associated protein GldL
MSDKKFNFDEWWASPRTKRFIGAIYSLGASVVIIGAMFKILHLPGASITLGLGMVTEAFLFFIGVFDKPLPEYHWNNVFPQLLKEEAEPLDIKGGISGNNGIAAGPAQPNQGLNNLASAPALSALEMENLKSGIRNLAQSADQLTSLSNIASSSAHLGQSMDAASKAAEAYVNSQSNLTSSYAAIAERMTAVADGAAQYARNIESTNGVLSSINSVYELQLQNVKKQAELFGQQGQQLASAAAGLDRVSAEVAKLQEATAQAAAEGAKYQAGVAQLQQQIADLNKVYGNMLNALN